MSDKSYLSGEDESAIIFPEILEDEVTEELSMESLLSPLEFEEENNEQFKEAFKAGTNNKKVRKSSKDSEEKLLGQKSQSSSRAESRKNSIQNLQDQVRSLRQSLENDDFKPFQKPSIDSQISAKSIVSEAISSADEKGPRKSSIQLSDKVPAGEPVKQDSLKSDEKLLQAEKREIFELRSRFKKQAERRSIGQVTLRSFAPTSTMGGFFRRREEPNTFQLKPKRPILEFEVLAAIDDVLSTHSQDLLVYEDNSAKNLAKTIAGDVRSRLKGKYDR